MNHLEFKEQGNISVNYDGEIRTLEMAINDKKSLIKRSAISLLIFLSICLIVLGLITSNIIVTSTFFGILIAFLFSGIITVGVMLSVFIPYSSIYGEDTKDWKRKMLLDFLLKDNCNNIHLDNGILFIHSSSMDTDITLNDLISKCNWVGSVEVINKVDMSDIKKEIEMIIDIDSEEEKTLIKIQNR